MNSEGPQEWQDEETNLLDYWRAIQNHRWVVLGLIFVSVFMAALYSRFIATKIYEAKAAILAPRESSGGGNGIASALSGSGIGQLIGGLGNLIQSGGTNRDTFLAILKSRTIGEDLVSRFHLMDYYKVKFMEDAVKILQGATDIKVTKEGVITVAVEDKDPKLAADIANAYITSLDYLFAKLGTTDASRQRAFIAERLEKTEKSLRQAEETLRRFQEKNKAIVLTDQSKAAIDAVAKTRGEIAAAEVQLEVMRTFATESNPQVVQQKRQIEELKRQLSQTEYGQKLEIPLANAAAGQDRKDFQLPFVRVPELGMELIRLTRDVKVQETVFNLLTGQFEQAKISEARDTPTVQLLDKAVPPIQRSRPKTKLNMAIAGAVSLFVGVFLALFLEYLERIRRHQPKSA